MGGSSRVYGRFSGPFYNGEGHYSTSVSSKSNVTAWMFAIWNMTTLLPPSTVPSILIVVSAPLGLSLGDAEMLNDGDGLADGDADGEAEGVADGDALGLADGVAEAEALGLPEGVAETVALGDAEGVAETDALGDSDGVADGDGDAEGEPLGVDETLGLADGVADADALGEDDGVADAEADGLAEGVAETEALGLADGVADGVAETEELGLDDGVAEPPPPVNDQLSHNDPVPECEAQPCLVAVLLKLLLTEHTSIPSTLHEILSPLNSTDKTSVAAGAEPPESSRLNEPACLR